VPKAAKRRFVDEVQDELARLLSDIGGTEE